MKNIITLALIASMTLVGCTSPKEEKYQNSKEPLVLKKSLKPKTFVDNQLVVVGEKPAIVKFFKDQGIAANISGVMTDTYLAKFKSVDSVDIENLSAQLSTLSAVDFAEPNYIFEPVGYKEKIDMDKWAKDKHFFHQWYLNNIGQKAPYSLPGKRNADVDILKAWGITKGSKDIRVGVIDTGIDYKHPDLRDSMWINQAEKNGIAGKDDDGNGYTDDIYGYNFVSIGLTSLGYGNVPGTSDPMDHSGHGTHVAGTIAAQSNSIGMAGVAPNVKLVAIRGLGDSGGSSIDLARAIEYGIKTKVDILSNSWGGAGQAQLIQRQVELANKAGILFVAAAGNSSVNNDVKPHYPSSYLKRGSLERIENIISVGASDNQDNPADFSNYGYETVDLFAPGTMILSTYPVKKSPSKRSAYTLMSGTSMATPVVSGIAALMLSANPSLKGNPSLLRKIMLETVDVVPSMAGKVLTNGRVNAYKALAYKADETVPPFTWQTKPVHISEPGRNSELVDIRRTIEVPGAKSVQAHFSFLHINEPYDSVYFYDKNLKYIGSMEQSSGVDKWSPIVPGDTLHIRFVNSKLRTVTVMPNIKGAADESTCSEAGGDYVQVRSGSFQCNADSMKPMSQGGAEEYISYNSEGYEIDQVRYLNQ